MLRSTFARNSAANALFFAVAALVFLAFTVLYTRIFGVEQYGTFSFLLNTVTALISLGAYEGFLITCSLTQTRTAFDAFNRRFLAFNSALVSVAAATFALVVGRLDPVLVLPVAAAIFLDYHAQSSIAVLITHDDNWKIRACRTAYQILLVAGFLTLRLAGMALDHAFGIAALAASLTNYWLLVLSARRCLPYTAPGCPPLADATPRLFAIAILSNLATVLALLLDKAAIRMFDVGTGYSVGLYFLFFDLAMRAEALYLLVSVPVTNHLFKRAQSGDLAGRDIAFMVAGSVVTGAVFAVVGHLLVPLIYGVSLSEAMALPWLFGLYVAARGIRFIIKAVCNATGLHVTLMVSNYLVFAAGATMIASALYLGGGALSVAALAGIVAIAQLLRAPVLAKVLISRRGIGERMKLGVA